MPQTRTGSMSRRQPNVRGRRRFYLEGQSREGNNYLRPREAWEGRKGKGTGKREAEKIRDSLPIRILPSRVSQ